ncbi:MAG TPA: outer membrane beta-barrel protein [Acidobacteriaceae bacterium]|nr:outer membrane beta-barrel protein [Acidobacteriaceae bacterium]
MQRLCLVFLFAVLSGLTAHAQTSAATPAPVDARTEEIRELRAELTRLAARLDALEHSEPGASAAAAPTPPTPPLGAPPAPAAAAVAAAAPAPPPVQPVPAAAPAPEARASILPTALPGGATLNYTFDGYYEYNFNQPPGRVNDLRAYDVLSNTISINQATLMLELAPDLDQKRRYGLRLDLQYGQATDTLQGNPANEPRPSIYQNIFQAYGTYIVPVGKGLTLDVGKWSSSLGVEGNYTKDQADYTRSFYFYFLPFYHEGVRAGYQVNDKLKLNYWLVNGTNQSEPTNGFKDELFGFVLTPSKKITWTSNYYFGQEHPDNTQATNCIIPEQPGLCVSPIIPAPNGKLHIFDNYVTWQATSKLALTGEGDYVIQRLWANAAPGESSAPSHLDGGAAYAQYQATPRISFAARGEYMSDRSGLFSNVSQALKEATGTYKHQVADNFDVFLEFRRDWTNQQYFRTHNPGVLADHQSTATIGLVWWYGGKQGSW